MAKATNVKVYSQLIQKLITWRCLKLNGWLATQKYLVIGHASTTSASAQAVAIICWTHLFFLFRLNTFSIISFFPIMNDVFTSVIINQVFMVLFFVINNNLWL